MNFDKIKRFIRQIQSDQFSHKHTNLGDQRIMRPRFGNQSRNIAAFRPPHLRIGIPVRRNIKIVRLSPPKPIYSTAFG